MLESTIALILLATIASLVIDTARYGAKLVRAIARGPRPRRRVLMPIDWTAAPPPPVRLLDASNAGAEPLPAPGAAFQINETARTP
jgi:hypothetical protein